MAQAVFGIIVAFLFAGCSLGPDYLRPKILIPDDHRGALEAPRAESLADIPWWNLFNDPVLQELTRELGQDIRRTVMIGDTTHDLLMANAAGAHGIAVQYGAHPVDQLHACNPVYSATSVPELHQWLAEHA